MKNIMLRRTAISLLFSLLCICFASCSADEVKYSEKEFASSFGDYTITATDYWTSIDSPTYDISLFHGTNQSVNSLIYYTDDLPADVSIEDIIRLKAERYKASYNSFSTINDIEETTYENKSVFSALYKATTSNSSGYIYINAVDMSETDNAYILFINCSPVSDFNKYKDEFDGMANSARIVGKPNYSDETAQKVSVSASGNKFSVDVPEYWSVSKDGGNYDLWLDYGQAGVGIYTYDSSDGTSAKSSEEILEAQAEKISKIFPEFSFVKKLDEIKLNGKSHIGSVYAANDENSKSYIRLNIVSFDDNINKKLVFIHVAPVTMFGLIEGDIDGMLSSSNIN